MKKINNWYKNLSHGTKAVIYLMGMILSLPTITGMLFIVFKLTT